MTAFMTTEGLLRNTRLPQGATNSVAVFVRVMNEILQGLIPKVTMPFMDNIGVKGPYTRYDNKEALPGICRYIYEHIQNLDKILERLERAGASIGPKSQFLKAGILVVGYVCTSEGRSLSTSKVLKILEWPACRNATEGKAFLGVCVYFRIWIRNFAVISSPIYKLFQKGKEWEW